MYKEDRIVKEPAEIIVDENDRKLASERDREIFINAVFGESKPNQNLSEAAKKYKSQISSKGKWT